MALRQLDPNTLGAKRHLILAAVAATWATQGQGPTRVSLCKLGSWDRAQLHYLLVALERDGWIIDVAGKGHCLTPPACEALGCPLPEAVA